MNAEKVRNNNLAGIDRIANLKRKINHLKAMIIVEKELFLKEDLRARKMEMQ